MKLAALTAAFSLAASPGLALDFGNGFSLVGEVELEYLTSNGDDETMSFTDLTLGWRSQGGGPIGFGFDISVVDTRSLSDGDSLNGVWGAAVLTTPYGEFAAGRPRPVLDRMFMVPQIGGTQYIDLLLTSYAGIDGSLLATLNLTSDISSRGLTFKGSSGGLTYGAGLHRFSSGGTDVDGVEIGGSYSIGQTEIFAGYESLDIPGTSIDRSRLGLRYAADRWSVGAHLAKLDTATLDVSTGVLFGDYRITDAFTVGAQFMSVSIGPANVEFYGLTGEYGFATNGFAQLGVLSQDDIGDAIYSASVGYRF